MPEDYERFLRQHVIESNRQNTKNTWILCQGDDQTEYYFHEYTRAISWDKPADYVEPVVYAQPVDDKHSSVQQVRGKEYASRHTMAERKSKDISGKNKTTDNDSDFATWVLT